VHIPYPQQEEHHQQVNDAKEGENATVTDNANIASDIDDDQNKGNSKDKDNSSSPENEHNTNNNNNNNNNNNSNTPSINLASGDSNTTYMDKLQALMELLEQQQNSSTFNHSVPSAGIGNGNSNNINLLNINRDYMGNPVTVNQDTYNGNNSNWDGETEHWRRRGFRGQSTGGVQFSGRGKRGRGRGFGRQWHNRTEHNSTAEGGERGFRTRRQNEVREDSS